MAVLRRIIEELERRSEERMQEMRALIKIMTAAVSRQPNVSKGVKNALPQFEAIIDHLEETNRDGNEARSKLSSFVASTGGSDNKRQACASPLAPAERAKLAKKKKGVRRYKNSPPKNGPSFKTVKRRRRGKGESKITLCQSPKLQKRIKRSGSLDP